MTMYDNGNVWQCACLTEGYVMCQNSYKTETKEVEDLLVTHWYIMYLPSRQRQSDTVACNEARIFEEKGI